MRSRLGLVLFVFGLAIVASGCLSQQGADKTTAEVEAIAKKLGELIGENDAEGIADLLVFPATLMYYDDAYTFTSRQEFIALTDFSYPDGTLHKHEVSVPHILAHENYASTIVRMVSDWSDPWDEWREIVLLEVKLVRVGKDWKINIVQIASLEYFWLDSVDDVD